MQLSLISDAIFSKDNFRQPYLDQEWTIDIAEPISFCFMTGQMVVMHMTFMKGDQAKPIVVPVDYGYSFKRETEKL
jgi:hypothetical protein